MVRVTTKPFRSSWEGGSGGTDFPHKAYFEDVVCVGEGPASVWVEVDGEVVNIPNSQVDNESEVWRMGQRGRLGVNEWIARERGLV